MTQTKCFAEIWFNPDGLTDCPFGPREPVAPCGPGGPRGPGNPGAPAIPGPPFKEVKELACRTEECEATNKDSSLTVDPLAPGIPSVPGLPCKDREEETMDHTLKASFNV